MVDRDGVGDERPDVRLVGDALQLVQVIQHDVRQGVEGMLFEV